MPTSSARFLIFCLVRVLLMRKTFSQLIRIDVSHVITVKQRVLQLMADLAVSTEKVEKALPQFRSLFRVAIARILSV
jgi:hypothetical protein